MHSLHTCAFAAVHNTTHTLRRCVYFVLPHKGKLYPKRYISAPTLIIDRIKKNDHIGVTERTTAFVAFVVVPAG